MTIFNHEMKQGFKILLIWSSIVSAMILICMLMFPQMKDQMGNITEMFSSMGGFTEAFGMDKLSFGNVMGFYGIECGNMLGIGGAFFAALLGVRMLAKEESEHTAEFLLTHPVSRLRVTMEKLAAVIAQLILFNSICIAFALLSFPIIGEKVLWEEFWLFHLAQFILQAEIACICFCMSAFLRRGGMGSGLGVAALMYFLNIIANITSKADFLRYVTPFSYAQASEIIPSASIDGTLILIGLFFSLVCITAAVVKYCKKDIYS